MSQGPDIARTASLVADPARAAMVGALMDGRALTAGELADVAGITRQTASSHLARLLDGGAVNVEPQGRHRYFRLSGPDVAELIEAMMAFSEGGIRRPRTGPADPELRRARICYDHLAGDMGVALYDRLIADMWVTPARNGLTSHGIARLSQIGVDPQDIPQTRRPLCRSCLDWSVRRPHLGGRLGAAILTGLLEQGWARRVDGSRAIRFTPDGARRFDLWLRPGYPRSR